MMDS
jgi:uncharacterized membrane protein HdeD (DUF308 family)